MKSHGTARNSGMRNAINLKLNSKDKIIGCAGTLTDGKANSVDLLIKIGCFV